MLTFFLNDDFTKNNLIVQTPYFHRVSDQNATEAQILVLKPVPAQGPDVTHIPTNNSTDIEIAQSQWKTQRGMDSQLRLEMLESDR